MEFPHWDYFLSLDSDLNEISKFIEVHSDNFKTYSIQLARLYLSACSEVDVISKLFCEVISPGQLHQIMSKRQYSNIADYRQVITEHCPKFYKMTINLPRYGFSVIPWLDYKAGKTPSWWTEYNDVKHNRDIFFHKANLRNTIESIAGLFVLTVYYYSYCRSGQFMHGINFPPKVLAADSHVEGTQWANYLFYLPPDKDSKM
jgi:hypothetical protein